MFKKYLTTAVGVLALTCLLAQTGRMDTSTSQIITFQSVTTANGGPTYTGTKKNAVGMGLLSWVQGYQGFYYERELFDFLSIKAGAGVTFRSFTNDLGQLIWNDGTRSETYDNNPFFSDITDNYEHYQYRRPGVGFYAAIAPKFYVASNGMDGFTVYPMLEYKMFNSRAYVPATGINQTYSSNDNYMPHSKTVFIKERMNCLDFTINIGGTYQTGKNFFVEWRLGMGLRKTYNTRLDTGWYDTTQSFVYTTRNYQKIKPLGSVDLILGGLF